MIIRWWDALEGLETGHGSSAAGGLVRDHATDGTPEHLGWAAEVPWSTAGRVVAGLLAEEGLVLYCCVDIMLVLLSIVSWRGDCGSSVSGLGVSRGRTLRSEEFAGDVEGFAAYNNDLLAWY